MRAKRNRIGLLTASLPPVFCVAVCAATVYFVHANTQTAAETIPSPRADGNVKVDTPIDPEGRQKELNAIVEEGIVAFSVNATPLMMNGRGKANLYIENPPENGGRFTVTIIHDDTGEGIYRSGYLGPKQYINETALDVELGKGEYVRTVNFDTYCIRDNSYIGRATMQITLHVLE